MATKSRKAAEKATQGVTQRIGEGAKGVAEKLGDGTKGVRTAVGDGVTVARQRIGEVRGTGEKVAADVLDTSKKARRRARKAGKKAGRRVKGARKRVGYVIAGEKPRKRKGRVLLAAGAGAVAAFFLDPVSGKRRRHVARDKLASTARSVSDKAQQKGRYLRSTAAGKLEQARNLRDEQPENDQVLAHKVESEVFQSDDIPKGQINVNAENGVVVLRGEVKTPDLVNDIEARVRRVQGVRDVRNLLHLPGTPAPTTTESPPVGPPTG